MVGISIDSERLKVVNPFIEKLGVNYTILLGEPNLMDKYNIMAIPTAVLIDQSGNIRKRFTGAQLDRLIYENELKKLLWKNCRWLSWWAELSASEVVQHTLRKTNNFNLTYQVL